jgi:16S rRNA (uracil1498-N3)-methyltransferase
MNRFFIPPGWIQPPHVQFEGEVAHQIVRVLRLFPGTIVTVLDGSGIERQVRLTDLGRGHVEGEIVSEMLSSGEPCHHLSLYIGLTQRAKFEYILQKGTELGVMTFVPVVTSRSLVRETAGESRKAERWECILREAAEQCGRGRIPEIQAVVPLSRALVEGKESHQVCLIAWEKEAATSLNECLTTGPHDQLVTVAALIGPEGGFSDDEANQAIDQGWRPVSLGRRILRMETAAISLAALILYELGELKPPGDAEAGS